MFLRAAVIWFSLMLAAILNGYLRDTALVQRLGPQSARAVSCLTLSGVILVVTWLSIRWMSPSSTADAWRVGVFWLGMTLTFEFLAGHYLFHTPWATLLADYNVLRGRLWVVVLIATVAAPAIIYRIFPNRVESSPSRIRQVLPLL